MPSIFIPLMGRIKPYLVCHTCNDLYSNKYSYFKKRLTHSNNRNDYFHRTENLIKNTLKWNTNVKRVHLGLHFTSLFFLVK